MWWIFQIIAMMLITVALMFARWYGLGHTGIFVPWAFKLGLEVIIAFLLIKSYMLAPGFLQPWFLGTAVLAVAGFLGSVFFFGEPIVLTKIIGAGLALVSAILLIM